MPVQKIEEEPKKPQRWIFRFPMDTGFVVKKSGKEIIRDTNGTAIDTIKVPAIKINVIGGLLVVNEAMGRKHGIEPAVIAKLIKKNPGFNKKFWCVEEPDKVLTEEESKAIEEAIAAKDKFPKGPRVHRGARGIRR